MKSVNAVTIKELYDLSHTEAKPLMEQYTYPWEVLPHIGEFIVKLGESLPKEEYTEVAEHVWVHKTAKVFASAYLAGPAIIGAETEVRQCAFVRGNALVGKGCVIGNSTELKNVIIFDNVQVPHYNYVGDSILGFKSHMGAGSIFLTGWLKSSCTSASSPSNVILNPLRITRRPAPPASTTPASFKTGSISGVF